MLGLMGASFVLSQPLSLLAWLGIACLACGGAAETGAPGDGETGGAAVGGGASGGSAAAGGTSTGGTSFGGHPSTGGSSPGGGAVGGTGAWGACLVNEDCVAVLNTASPCFSPYCSAPIAASQRDLARERCLVPWEERGGELPPNCGSEGELACPAVCALPPECVTPRCDAGACVLDVGYSAEECESPVDTCAELDAIRQSTLREARGCNAELDVVQCSGAAVIEDECGCEVLVNEAQPLLVDTARRALAAWQSHGCQPPPRCATAGCSSTEGGLCYTHDTGQYCTPDLKVR